MPGQEPQTAITAEREAPETAPDPNRREPHGGDWEAYSLDVLNDLLDA